MNNLCNKCHAWFASRGRDVELYASKPLMPRPCVRCSKETQDLLVPWSNWARAPYCVIEPPSQVHGNEEKT